MDSGGANKQLRSSKTFVAGFSACTDTDGMFGADIGDVRGKMVQTSLTFLFGALPFFFLQQRSTQSCASSMVVVPIFLYEVLGI